MRQPSFREIAAAILNRKWVARLPARGQMKIGKWNPFLVDWRMDAEPALCCWLVAPADDGSKMMNAQTFT